ncbi:histidine kinase [Halovenus sp. WSH3]|uniref:Histidine kinase n=1 Tax=Halovenus carboxidivorans TaxID=2692199 RepID=A0A6B0TEE3_9EURY|nr:sensor domain-containing protein [Halovenus carboxidivorans]MXR51569.1 histidine kinase [Halovenus carboxidivorans]
MGTRSATNSGGRSISGRSVTDGQTYRNLLYLFLSFPLGLAYFVAVVTGVALGLGLSVLVVGIGILFGTLLAVQAIAGFERRLANSLLGTDIAAPDDIDRGGSGAVGTAMAYVRAASTWRSLGFVLLKFWLGIGAFVLLVALFGTAVELLLLPVYPDGALNVQVFGWEAADTFRTETQRLLAVPVGSVLAIVALPVLNSFARVNAIVAEALLGPDGSARRLDENRG